MAGKKTGSANQNTRKKMNPQRIPGAREQRAASGRTVQTRPVAGARSGRQQAAAQRARAERNADRERVSEKNRRNKATEQSYEPQSEIGQNVFLVVAILISVIVFLSYIGVCGAFGDAVNSIVFGLFGVLGYVFPFVFAGLSAYSALSRRSDLSAGKIAGIIIMFVLIAALVQIALGGYSEEVKLLDYYSHSAPGYEGSMRTYGGLLGGTISYLFCPMLGNVATVVILLAAIIILLILVTGKAIFSYIRDMTEEKNAQRRERRENYPEDEPDEDPDAEYYRGNLFDDHRLVRRRIRLQSPVVIEKVGDIMEEDDPDELFGWKNKKKKNESGFIDDLRKRGSTSEDPEKESGQKSEDVLQAAFELEEIGGRRSIADTDEINSEEELQTDVPFYKQELERKYGSKSIEIANLRRSPYADSIVIGRTEDVGPFYDDPDVEIFDKPDNVVTFPHAGATKEEPERASFLFDEEEELKASDTGYDSDINDAFGVDASSEEETPLRDALERKATVRKKPEKPAQTKQNSAQSESTEQDSSSEELEMNDEPVIRQYAFPPIDILKKPKGGGRTTSDAELRETARKLEDTFESFGVGVTVTDVSCGPTVTRYELHPEQGVKVSKITALTDDIKLNLAAADIRIEAPIPGKAAVGIEIPNKENTVVLLRELLESGEFESHSSNIAFAVGKDIGGKTVVTDIAKMPHLLIAGATGSGKSVCINTLIMSILYKARPEDVKLIMVDPKVVELSVYNGIPHLLIPVVTDPKKASAALNWAVMEMTNRYKLFADAGVRDLKGYNERVDEELLRPRAEGEPTVLLNRLPQIVIIVDELADLMMVAPGEVEDAICRLAQLARAAGIHLVIATQRPSVNVITGLIKANVPSRIAFAVSSAIDSRTILDGGGAEKLLGRGDMLFFPSGYPKPVRLQGAFVSDKEVADVVDFLKGQCEDASDKGAEIERQIETVSLEAAKPAQAPDDGRDEYFAEAARFIIEKEKASIGLLQRVYKIGFNRAARIMDQLCEAGVVGPEEGTKPRKILMTLEDLDNLLGAEAPKGGTI